MLFSGFYLMKADAILLTAVDLDTVEVREWQVSF